jgi:hypothetical protein
MFEPLRNPTIGATVAEIGSGWGALAFTWLDSLARV